jgi:adenylate cyclase
VELAAQPWLELASGESVPIAGTCSIGRAHSNQLVLPDEKVSRHHALIQALDSHECWIVDLGSANGTYVNGRRIEQALLLRERDEITIGPARITFRTFDTASIRRDDGEGLERTVHDVRQLTAWLFLVDVIDSTGISRRLGPHAMARIFDAWLACCREVLESRGGIIDKPLGDGFFAFWPTEWAPERVADAVMAFRKLQGTAGDLPFRMVLHRGAAFTGGQMASGIYRLFGPEVTFTFRMESLAKSLKIDCLLSEAAMGALGHHVATTPAGSHRVPGMDGSFSFFRL